MTEERGSYNLHDADADRDVQEVPCVGDILRQLSDERGWPPLPGVMPANGSHSSAEGNPGHGDA